LNLPSPTSPDPEKVKILFDGLAERYDSFNKIASLGLDQLWRKSLIQLLNQFELKDKKILDLGTGTGDLIFDCLKNGLGKNHPAFLGIDLSQPMLNKAKKKLLLYESEACVQLLQANGTRVPCASNQIDFVISAFLLRNVKKVLKEVLFEIKRILKPEGKIFLLELVAPEGIFLPILHKIYLKTMLPLVGKTIFKNSWSKDYLSETILQFGKPEDFSKILKEANFKDVSYISLTKGMAVIHTASY